MLLYSVATRLTRLKLSPSGVKVERDRRPRWLGDYRYYKTNADTLPVACLSAMQYGCALERLLCEIVFADPALGTVYTLKADVLNSFYCMGVQPEDMTKIGLIFPRGSNEDPMVSTHLKLPWDVRTPCLYG